MDPSAVEAALGRSGSPHTLRKLAILWGDDSEGNQRQQSPLRRENNTCRCRLWWPANLQGGLLTAGNYDGVKLLLEAGAAGWTRRRRSGRLARTLQALAFGLLGQKPEAIESTNISIPVSARGLPGAALRSGEVLSWWRRCHQTTGCWLVRTRLPAKVVRPAV